MGERRRSLADDAEAARRRRFVGRAEEITAVEDAVADGRGALFWVFGPGGVGKSSLLAELAARATLPVHAVDLSAVDRSPTTLVTVLPTDRADEAGPRLLLLDGYEPSTGLGPWLRDQALGQLPSGSVVVLASRHPPDPGWRDDPRWFELVRLLPLRNLDDSAAAEVLARHHVTGEAATAALRLARGHPLALTLLGTTLAGPAGDEPVPEEWADAPDLLAAVLGRIVDEVPDERHRQALEVLALARVTTTPLLRSLFGPEDGKELGEWLRHQPFVRATAEGLCPHDLAREIIEADLRRRDPDGYGDRHRAIRSHALDGMDRPGRADASFRDIIFLHRGSSTMSGYWDWSSFGAVVETPVRAEDRATLATICRAHVGDDAVAVLDHWLDRAPDRFTVVRSVGGDILGFFAILVLVGLTDHDREVDPLVATLWDHAARNDPLRHDQVMGITRFNLDREVGQGPSATFGALTAATMRHWLTTPGLAWDHIVVTDPDYWSPLMAYLDYHRLMAGKHQAGTQVGAVFSHDWRRTGPAAWLDLMEERELGARVDAPAAGPAPEPVALDRAAFDLAVREALRALARPDQLATNPLLASRLVREQAPTPDAAGLSLLLRDAVAAIPSSPRNDRARRAVDRTFLHGEVTQEAAAEVLDLAFSTYRRHLAAGVAMVAEHLWSLELYGEAIG